MIALAALLLVAAILALAPTHGAVERAHRVTTQATTGTTRGPPVSGAQLARARQAARMFFAGYLPFAYGQAPASSVSAVEPGLRRELMRELALITPVERRRHPQVLSLTAFGQAPGIVIATALIADGGIANYAIRLTVRGSSGGWLVSGVDGG